MGAFFVIPGRREWPMGERVACLTYRAPDARLVPRKTGVQPEGQGFRCEGLGLCCDAPGKPACFSGEGQPCQVTASVHTAFPRDHATWFVGRLAAAGRGEARG